jgi:hypothetical protein
VTCSVLTLSLFIFLLSSSRIDCSGRGVLAGIAVRSLRVAGKGDETNLKNLYWYSLSLCRPQYAVKACSNIVHEVECRPQVGPKAIVRTRKASKISERELHNLASLSVYRAIVIGACNTHFPSKDASRPGNTSSHAQAGQNISPLQP